MRHSIFDTVNDTLEIVIFVMPEAWEHWELDG